MSRSARSWVPIPDGSDFPIENLPFGIFDPGDGERRVGVAVGDHIVDMAALEAHGVFADAAPTGSVFSRPTLNPFLALGGPAWERVRSVLTHLLSQPEAPASPDPASFLVPMAECRLHLAVEIGDYVDFYSSIEHATNLGKIFRPGDPPLLPNWRSLPVGYHGRTGSIVVSGTDVVRPSGQMKPADGPPIHGPSRRLDFELEVGFITGPANRPGQPIPVDHAEDRIFGLVLVNDWSARDIQAWEYRPLGPFLGKSFATTISPWVVPLAALLPYRVPAASQDPEPLGYLRADPNLAVDLRLEVEINGTTVSRTNLTNTYWTMAQQLAHATVNGAVVRPGDLFASGTVSGPSPSSYGSLVELSWNGAHPVALDDGSTRTFLEDGDIVTMRAWCEAPDQPRVGFGECTGRVVATPA